MTKVIHTKTIEEFTRVLKIFDKKGWIWSSGCKPLEKISFWNEYKKQTCIGYENYFGYSPKEWHERNGWEVISFKEFLEMEKEQPKIHPDFIGDNSNTMKEGTINPEQPKGCETPFKLSNYIELVERKDDVGMTEVLLKTKVEEFVRLLKDLSKTAISTKEFREGINKLAGENLK